MSTPRWKLPAWHDVRRMGWWENIDGYLVGDPTADVMGEALEPFEASPVAVAELLHLLNAAVRAEQTSLHDSRALDYGPICARLTDGTRIEPKATRDDPSAVEALRAGVRAVGSIFEGQFHRKPSLGELLATLDFVLDLDKHLADSGA